MADTTSLTRRQVLKVSGLTFAGYAMAPDRALADAIKTDTQGLVAGETEVAIGSYKLPVYEARPATGSNFPILLVISEIWGVHEYVRDSTRRFAKEGFYAIAPELYFREGGMQGKDFQQMSQISGKVTRAQYLGDLRAAADYAKQQSWARADRMGVTGFCGGGALTLHFTAEYPGVSAAAPWYGQVKRAYSDAPGVDAFSLMDKIKAPVLGFYGEADTGIPVEDVKRFEAELRKTNPNVEFVLYPGAPHAFFSDDRPQVYRKEASEDAWKRCVAFFDKHLKS